MCHGDCSQTQFDPRWLLKQSAAFTKLHLDILKIFLSGMQIVSRIAIQAVEYAVLNAN